MTPPSKTRSMCFEVAKSNPWLSKLVDQFMYVVSVKQTDRRVVFVPLGESGWKLSMGNVTAEQEKNEQFLLNEVYERCGLKLEEDEICHLSFYNIRSFVCQCLHNEDGNIFLAGDSAHTFLPFGGHGLNEAIGDALAYAKAIKSEEKNLIQVADQRLNRALEVAKLVEEEKKKYYVKK